MLEVENQTPAPFRLQVLGGAWLESGTTSPVTLERKVAALLTLLALEGPTTRSRMAGLLWADRLEDVARSNLRQCLRRLRNLTGTELVGADDTLRLVPDIRVDALRLESLVFTGEYAPALELEGVLLAGLEYEDCPEFEEWLHSTRDRLENARREALSAETDRLEREGNLVAALGLASRLLERDQLSEGAYRQVMRLHYLQGDRSSALAAFDRCCKTLNSKLDLEPSPETLDLAGLIERGSNLPQMVLPSRTSIPLSILRPPVLVGRAREWALLEAAWEARKVVFLVGDAGIGKSRLMLDFVATKGAFLPHNGRPGDAQIPYSTFSRGLRTIVGGDDQPARLPAPWICRELLRLVPEKAVRFGLELPAPIGSRDELLRFFDAITEFTRLSPHQWVAFVSDDLQFYDTASFELRMYMSGRLTDAEGQLIRNLIAYRRGALSPAIQALVEQMLASDQAVLIDLEALEPPAIQSFLTELALPGLERFSPAISRYTGGNPMFMLETLKHLIETDTLEQDFPEHLPPPGRIGALVRQRLELLSAAALRLARVAAIAGTDFSLELGAKVLETNWVDLTEPLVELEQAQVMKAEKFSHDLIFEATLEGVPAPIRTLIHQRCAEYLEMVKGEPARIAHHWLEANDQPKAVPWLLEVQSTMSQNGLLQESVALLERVINYSAAVNDHLQILATLAERYKSLAKIEEAEELVMQVLQNPSNPRASATALRVLTEIRYTQGRYKEALALIEQGIPLAKSTGDMVIIDGFQMIAAYIAFRQQRFADAVQIMEPMLEQYKNTESSTNYLSIAMSLATCYRQVGRYTEFEVLNQNALRIARQIQSNLHIVSAISEYLAASLERGNPENVVAEAEEALMLGEYDTSIGLRQNLAHVYFRLYRNEDAIKHYFVLLERNTAFHHCMAWANLAVLYDRTGQKKESALALEKSIECLPFNSYWGAKLAVTRAVLMIGSNEQFTRVEPYYSELDLNLLSRTDRNELEELLSARKHRLDTNTP